MSDATSRPLPPHLLVKIDESIAHTKAAMEHLEQALDEHWRALAIFAEIKTSGRMTVQQRLDLQGWL